MTNRMIRQMLPKLFQQLRHSLSMESEGFEFFCNCDPTYAEELCRDVSNVRIENKAYDMYGVLLEDCVSVWIEMNSDSEPLFKAIEKMNNQEEKK